MHPATELILSRMDSNPEEFTLRDGRWSKILLRLSDAAPEGEWKAIHDKLKTIRMEKIHQDTMKELCASESTSSSNIFSNYTTTTPNITYKSTLLTPDDLDYVVDNVEFFERQKARQSL